ncbi:hypothetical protein [Mongoliitalea lutea]|uniref:Uncharacterized protein n=1 Tax=Mongoliitalea lutea TaxID=849756 RepID=A0A8J3D195_9BACT|nr:hypothetical protein [Mongoliitalea lutea]GHB45109.1 hypothetical protein GCM10008106_27580 [Mongoliitalea lutea]
MRIKIPKIGYFFAGYEDVGEVIYSPRLLGFTSSFTLVEQIQVIHFSATGKKNKTRLMKMLVQQAIASLLISD